MTWVFDSKLPKPVRTLIENAIIAKLARYTVPSGGWLEALISIGFSIKGPNDDLGIDNLWQELNGRTPAVAVTTTKLSGSDGGAQGLSDGHLTVELYFVSSHRRGLTDGRTASDIASDISDANDPGLHAALELVWMQLLGADLGIGPQVADLRFLEEDEIISDNEKTIWQQTWRVRVDRDVNLLRDSVQKLTGLAANAKAPGELAGVSVVTRL